jgi:peroxiredoxin
MSYLFKGRYLISVIILLLGAGWIWISRIPEVPTPEAQAPQAGFHAPDFILTSQNGTQISLDELKGKPLIINFWASWCPPCRAEMPSFQQVSQEYSDAGLVVVGINLTNQDSLAEVSAFVNQNQLSFPVLLDEYGTVSQIYNVHSLPTTFFVDRNGVIQRVIIGGPIPLSLMRIEIANLIEDQP